MWNCFSLPPHTTAKQSVSGRCRGSREAGSLPRQAGRGPGLCSTATASEPHHSNTPRVKTKHKTPYLPGLYKKLKVKEEKNNVILGEEEEILLSPHNTRCVLPFDNVQRRRNSSMRPEAGTGQQGSRGPARRCRAALRLQTCIGTYYRCSFTGVYYNSVRGTETYATTAKKCKRYRKLICKNWQETNISRAQFPQSALPEDTWPPPPQVLRQAGVVVARTGLATWAYGEVSGWGKHVIDKSIYCRGGGEAVLSVYIIHCSPMSCYPYSFKMLLKTAI